MKWYKYVICSIVSLATGAYGGYLIACKKLKARHEREIESMKEAQKNHDEYMKKLWGVKDQKRPGKPLPNPEEKPTDPRQGFSVTGNKVTYNDIAKVYRGENIKNPESKEKSDIYLITETEYNESSYSYETLYYYKGDGVISDSDYNAVDNYRSMIGSITVWGKFAGNNPVYVRNDAEEKDYEIIPMPGCWKDSASSEQVSRHSND